ncbi:MAG: VOC family protein [Anaerolineae bacterium]|jgi:predicted enzyme related to lactoylglutathione lyase
MTGADDEPGINGGLVRRTLPGATTINTIAVDDLNLAMARIIEAGGQIVSPRTIVPSVGFMCYAQDPEGNLFSIMEPGSESNKS